MKTNGTLISFVGSRGSGKTTIASLVYGQLKENGQSCIKQHPGFKRRPLLRGIITAISLWRFFDFKMLMSFGFRGRAQRRWPSLYRLYLPLAFNHDLYQLAKGNSDVLIYDSNVLRGIISAFASGDMDAKEIEDLYTKKILSKVNKITFVVVDTNPEDAIARWIVRDGVKLSDEEYKSAVNDRIKLMNDINAVIDLLSQLPQVSVLHLDGSVVPEKNSSLVVDSIN